MKTACARRAAMVLLALSVLPGCLKRETPVQAGIRTQTLLLGNGYEPGSLDPHLAGSYAEARIVCALFEGLTFLDEHGLAVPAAAERWDVSPDGLTYAFHLRPNLRWSNGDPVTPDDFVFSIQRMLNPKFPAEYAYMLWPLKGAKDFNQGKSSSFASVGAKALDARTLQLELENPTVLSSTRWALDLAARPSRDPRKIFSGNESDVKMGVAWQSGRQWSVHTGRMETGRADRREEKRALLGRAIDASE